MEQELKFFQQSRTWELVNLSDSHRPITLKWVFKLKKDEAGAVIKHKARLVAHGFI
jgi:predicted alpha/beta hydrolase family esterase